MLVNKRAIWCREAVTMMVRHDVQDKTLVFLLFYVRVCTRYCTVTEYSWCEITVLKGLGGVTTIILLKRYKVIPSSHLRPFHIFPRYRAKIMVVEIIDLL